MNANLYLNVSWHSGSELPQVLYINCLNNNVVKNITQNLPASPVVQALVTVDQDQSRVRILPIKR
jgi:hypothetical protein